MATTRTVYVDSQTGSTSPTDPTLIGDPYQFLDDAFAAEAKDLITLDRLLEIVCLDGHLDSNRTSLDDSDGWLTDFANDQKIIIRAQSKRGDGPIQHGRANATIQENTTFNEMLAVIGVACEWHDFDFYHDGSSGGGGEAVECDPDSTAHRQIYRRCSFKSDAGSGATNKNNSAASALIYDACLFSESDSDGIQGSSSTDFIAIRCAMVLNDRYGVNTSSAFGNGASAIDCYIGGNTTADIDDNPGDDVGTATSDATATDVGLRNQTLAAATPVFFTNVTPGSIDLRITDAGSSLAAGGAFSSQSATIQGYSAGEDFNGIAYTDDDIGPHAYTQSAGDSVAPVITLTGDDPQTVERGSAYVEQGATATDDTDGDISGNIVIDASAVDINVVGSYGVTYNVSDAAGNPAVEVVRTVNVVDTVDPVLSLLTTPTITDSSVTPSAQVSELFGTFYGLVTPTGTDPLSADIRNDGVATVPTVAGSPFTMSDMFQNRTAPATFEAIQESIEYQLSGVYVDSGGNESNVQRVNFTTIDVSAPVYASVPAIVAPVSDTGFSVRAALTDANGITRYGAFVPAGSTAPTATEIRDGGGDVIARANSNPTSGLSDDLVFSGLTATVASTAYDYYEYAVDDQAPTAGSIQGPIRVVLPAEAQSGIDPAQQLLLTITGRTS